MEHWSTEHILAKARHPGTVAGGSWQPRALAKIRAQTARYLALPDTPLTAAVTHHPEFDLDVVAGHLRVGELYWVTPDMAALAVSAGTDLPDVRWTVADRPAAAGLIVFDGGISQSEALPGMPPIDAITWGPAPGGLLIALWSARKRVTTTLTHAGYRLGTDMPPLLPAAGHTYPIDGEATPTTDLKYRTAVTTLAAAWHLMQQPTLASGNRVHPDRSSGKWLARRGEHNPDVTVIDLRRQYIPDQPHDTGTDQTGRHYHHRWVVSGHWRNQPHGRDRAQRRRQWIPSHVKGPTGAPLLATTKVNVWRR